MAEIHIECPNCNNRIVVKLQSEVFADVSEADITPPHMVYNYAQYSDEKLDQVIRGMKEESRFLQTQLQRLNQEKERRTTDKDSTN